MESKIEFNIDDERAGKIAEVIANKTCKKILKVIAESENALSVGDISKKLGIPMNTTDYNVKKLIGSGLIEKTLNFFWSVKGKKIPTYKISNKKIIISPKTSFRGMLASIIAGGVIFGASKIFINNVAVKDSINLMKVNAGAEDFLYTAASKAVVAPDANISISLFTNILPWILVGLLVGLGIYFIIKLVRRYMN